MCDRQDIQLNLINTVFDTVTADATVVFLLVTDGIGSCKAAAFLCICDTADASIGKLSTKENSG